VPWKETTPVEERTVFIRAWEASVFTMGELCEHFGVSRKTGHKWIRRYLEDGVEGLGDRSRAPHGCAHRTASEVEAAIIAMRRMRSRWGPKKIIEELRRVEPERRWPAVSTAGAVLARAGLVRARRRQRRWGHPHQPLRPPEGCNELWTIDFKGEFRLGDRTVCYPLTIQDRWSRYVLACRGMAAPKQEAVQSEMEQVFRAVGLPERIRSDNGEPFASQGLAGLTRLNVWWMRLGIRHERTEKARPDQNGAHERMHRELKADTARPPACNLRAQQADFDLFVETYNDVRPHEGIGQQRPFELWRPSPRRYPKRLDEPEYPGHFEVRRVHSGGEISFRNRMCFVSQSLAGQSIGLEPVDDGVWSLVFATTLLGRFDERANRIIG
jgi:putative transposase